MAGKVYGFEHGGSRRYAELAAALMQVESADAPLPPGLILELDRPEWSYHKREKLWAAQITVAPAVGNTSWVALLNPSKSNFLVVVEAVIAANATLANVLELGSTAQNSPAGGVAAPTDSRWPRFLSSLGTVVTPLAGNGAAISTIHELQNIAVAQNVVFEHARRPLAVLSPGFTLVLQGTVNNAGFSGSWRGYERPATPDELSS